jgi:dihydroorotase
LLDDRLDVIATDHAPHTLGEKGLIRNSNGLITPPPMGEAGRGLYEKAHAGLPLVQHSLLLMLYYCKQGRITLEKIAEKMSHAVADCFRVSERGYIREGYFADLVIVDLNPHTTVSEENILYNCGWSPLENMEFPASVTHTFVNGNLVFENGRFDESQKGKRLRFER